MERATAPDLRKSLMMAHAMKDAGIRFVPMPAVDDGTFDRLFAEMQRKLELLAVIAEAAQGQ